MQCPECHFENPGDSKFCNQCGNKLEQSCPQCGKANPPGSKFCNACGHDLTTPKVAAPIDYNEPQSYTPKHLADKILTTRSSIEGERKLVTVLFADVAGSTAIFEKLDPEQVHEIMDGCFRILMDEIHRFEGTINQFRGDGVMALFGAPIAHEDHAQQACRASLAIQTALVPYAEKLKKAYGIEFETRVGLNSGSVVVGSIGDDLRMDYTAKGDTANLASRMESNAEPGTILISENTYRLAGDYFDFESKGKVQVKGKEEPVRVYQLIKAGEVETRIAASAAKGLTPFVGRKSELVTIKEAFEKAQSGSGQVVGVVGEAGAGKSRLVLEVRNMLPRGEYNYLEGRCLHYGGSMPYLPMLDVFRSYVGIKEGEQESVIKKKMKERILGLDENLRTVIPPFQELLSLKVDDDEYLRLDPKQKRVKTFEAVRDLLIRGSQERPLVLVIEDLHWIDKTSEELLDYMIGWLPTTPILLILLYRPEYTHQWGSKSSYSKLGVHHLSTDTSAELVRAILEGGQVDPELREFILGRTSGNPLFLEELTRTLLENGSIQRDHQQYVLAGSAADIQVPETIHGIIAARMDRLEESLKAILQVASVIGREFFFRILQAITGMREELKSYLLNLQGLEFIYEKRIFPEMEYIFKHALTQEVAYNSLLVKRRKQIHEQIGEAIEELFPERLEEFCEMLAYHYSKSDNKKKACQYLKSSGAKAMRSNSAREALAFFKQGLKILGQLPGTEENKKRQVEVILLMAPIMRLFGYPEGSLEILQQGERLSKDVGDRRSTAILYSSIGLCYSSTGRHVEGTEYQENSFSQAERMQEIELVAPIGYDLLILYVMKAQWGDLAGIASKVATMLEQAHREYDFFGRTAHSYSMMQGTCAAAMGALGKFKEAKPLLEKGLSFAHEIGHPYSIGVAEFAAGNYYRFKGDGENAVKHFLDAIKYFEESQTMIWIDQCWTGAGYGHYLLGELETALEHMEKGLEIKKAFPIPFWLSNHHCCLSMVHFDLGDVEKAQSHAEKAVTISHQNHERSWEGFSRIVMGRIMGRVEESKLDDAEKCILDGAKILEDLKAKAFYSLSYLYLGELYSQAGRKQGGLENLRKAERMFLEMGMDYWLIKTKEVLSRL